MKEVMEKIKALSKEKQSEIMAKLGTIKSVEDAVEMLKKAGIEVSTSIAKELMDKLGGKVSLMDDMLAGVAGGRNGSGGGIEC